MNNHYESCIACPRKCKVDRNHGVTGFCREVSEIRIAWAGLHFGEEPPVTGIGGSGTIFISGCNLRCLFCQNFQISQDGIGKAVTIQEFSEICLTLQSIGAENINIVTGSHSIPSIADGLRCALKNGLAIPVLWNSSAYETPEALKLLDGLISVWLPDLKTLNPLLSGNVFQAQNYPNVAKAAIRYMVSNSPLKFENSDPENKLSGKIVSGVIVRHLALPGKIDDTALVLQWYAEHIADKALLSLMTQYTPVKNSPHSKDMNAFPDRPLEKNEFKTLKRLMSDMGIEEGFYQELVDDSSWLPDFTLIQPFSSKLARPVWHYTTGFLVHRLNECFPF